MMMCDGFLGFANSLLNNQLTLDIIRSVLFQLVTNN